MIARKGPTLRAQWLGHELRKLRETAGFSLKEVGAYLQRDGSTISRFEAGIYPVRTVDVLALLNFYGVTDKQRRADLERLSHEVWQTGWWDEFSKVVSGRIVDYAWVESRAKAMMSFDALVVPGLLQTRAYMEEVIRADTPDALEVQVSRWIEFRLTRQEILQSDNAPQMIVALDESVLHRKIGGSDVLRDQLDYLVEVAERPGIDIRVLPFETGAHASLAGSFRIFEMIDPYPAVGYVQSPAGGIYVEADNVQRLTLNFERIYQDCPGTSDSVRLIEDAAGRLR